MRWDRTLLGGSPYGLLGVRPPPITRDVTLPPPPGSVIPHHLSPACCALGAHSAIRGVPPLRPGLGCVLWAHAVFPSPPPARVCFARTVAAEAPLWFLLPAARGVPVLLCSAVPPVTHCARCWVGGPPPLPPLAAARFKLAQPFGGSPYLHPSSGGLLHCERILGVPLWFLFLVAWGGPVDEDVGDWTGKVVARGLLAGGSAPRGKITSRPCVVLGDVICHPLFLHLPQK